MITSKLNSSVVSDESISAKDMNATSAEDLIKTHDSHVKAMAAIGLEV